MAPTVRFAFAGDRDGAVWTLDWLLGSGYRPVGLLVSAPSRASHARELIERCPFLPPERILAGKRFRSPEGRRMLAALDLDWIVGVHFPYLVPREVLELPRRGVLNLHPAFLPYNRGWHTPSWAILDGTPAGATLHFMDEGLDTGDVVHQKRIDPSPADTADTLYARFKALELEVFREAWPRLVDGTWTRTPQDPAAGTFHVRDELCRDDVRRIDLDRQVAPRDLLRRLRALTTNDPGEAAWFEEDGRRWRVQVRISPEPEPEG